MRYRTNTKRTPTKTLVAALAVMLAAHIVAVAADVADFQRRAARRRSAPVRRVGRPAAAGPAAGQQQPAKGGTKEGGTDAPREQREVSTNDSSTLGMTAEEALAVAIREALRRPGEGETRALGVLTRVECGPENAAIFHVRAGKETLKLDGGDLSGVHFTAFTPRETGSEIVCGPRKLDSPVVVTYRARAEGGGGRLVSVEFVPAGFTLEK